MNWRKRKSLNKLAKKHCLIHGYEYKQFIRKKVIKYRNRNKRVYSLELFNACCDDFKQRKIQDGKWLGEIDHPVHVDVAQNPDVTTEARIGISPKGDVKFYGFDICKT